MPTDVQIRTSGTDQVPQRGPRSRNGTFSNAARWAPALGGGALAILGLMRRSRGGAVMAAAGGAIAYGSLTGRTPLPDWVRSRLPAQEGGELYVERGFTVLRPPSEVYQYWRNFENLPSFMPHLQSVTVTDDRRSHWVTSGPAGTTVEWDAEIVDERPDELIRWQSLPGAQVANRGEVRFVPAPGDRGTEVRVSLEYDPPAGALGATIAQIFGQGPDRQVREAVRRFKSIMETSEIPTNDGQPMGTCLTG